MKYRDLVPCLILLIVSQLSACTPERSEETVMLDQFEVQLSANQSFTHSDVLLNTVFGVDVREVTLQFGRSDKTLSLVTRTLPNGDVIFYYALQGGDQASLSVKLTVNFDIKVSELLAPYEVTEPFSSVTGQEETTLPTAYLKSDDESMLVSKIIYSNTLTKTYENGFSTLREFWGESAVLIEDKDITIDLKPNAAHAEGWMILAQGQLFGEGELKTYIDWVQNSNETTWYTAQGHYSKIAWSIDPFTRRGYGRNPGTNLAMNEYKRYINDGRRIDYVLFYQKLLGLETLPRNDQGMILTEYTSTYVQKNSGINAPYVDSRFNEQISEFYEKVMGRFKFSELLPRIDDYAEYIIQQVESGTVNRIDDELYLLPDYFSDPMRNPPLLAHSSLNHSLGIANQLISTGLHTGKTTYIDYGLTIFRTIEQQGSKWLNDEGDTFYRMTPAGVFDSTDYKEVTLVDLLIAQRNLKKLGLDPSASFDVLIRSKLGYLRSIAYALSLSTEALLTEMGY